METPLKAKEVCALLGCSRSKLYELHGEGKLRAENTIFENGRGLRWRREDVVAYLDARRTGPAPKRPEPPRPQVRQRIPWEPLTIPGR